MSQKNEANNNINIYPLSPEEVVSLCCFAAFAALNKSNIEFALLQQASLAEIDSRVSRKHTEQYE